MLTHSRLTALKSAIWKKQSGEMLDIACELCGEPLRYQADPERVYCCRPIYQDFEAMYRMIARHTDEYDRFFDIYPVLCLHGVPIIVRPCRDTSL